MIKVYGASDDLIEVEGDIREEFNHIPDDEDDAVVIGFSDGTLLRANYDKDGIWRLTPICAGAAKYSKVEGVVKSDTNDMITLDGMIEWVVFGKAYHLK